MAGKLYGIGVGPGDPELLTLKALRIIASCEVIAVPGEKPQETTAYRIVSGAYADIDKKELVGIIMPMTKDEEKLRGHHLRAVHDICGYLDEGRDVAFLTLGDPTVYSTYIYIHKEVAAAGYATEVISGVPSFCAAAARLGIGIAEKEQQIHIIPASYQISQALTLPGTKVLMKAGKKLPVVKEQLKEQKAQVTMVENCGMPEERIYHGVEEIPEDAGYYTLIFVKEGEKI